MKTTYVVLLSMVAIPLAILTAVLVPLSSISYGQQDQGQASTLMVDDNSMTSPPHNMIKMMMGQDDSMNSDHSNGSQDNDAQNKPQSKVFDGVKVDFAAQSVIHTNELASIHIQVKDNKSGAKLSHVDWAITVKDPNGNLVYKTTTGHSHVGNMDFKVALSTAGENTVYLTTSSIGSTMMGLEVTPKGWTHTMLSGGPKGFAKDPQNDFGSRVFEFPIYVQNKDEKHTLQGTVQGTSVNVEMSTFSNEIVAGKPITFVFTVTKAKDDSMITHPDLQVTVKTGSYIVAQSAAVEGALAMNGAIHGHTGEMTLTEIFPNSGPYTLNVELQPSTLSNYMWGKANTSFDVFVSEPMGTVATATQTVAAPPANTVNIVGLEAPFFTPNALNIKSGTTVIFVNTDGNSHTVTSVKPGSTDSDGIFDSGIIHPGKTFSFKFDKPGTYEYICAIHTHMHGTINVS
ncbi:MAG: cupredoxin domain-containing protein [Thaumarchaeota archaeon]|nr:cupredoxin domain-containing protein [Nitrososphaerota archaeon]MBI3641733.1 cupredoxin domain-containing protein [Nitrososphaerota archaeon]